MFNLFANLKKSTFRGAGRVPCPVAWTPQAVDLETYADLVSAYPEPPSDPHPDNPDPGITRQLMVGPFAKNRPKLHPAWAAFWEYIERSFVKQALKFWADEIQLLYPGVTNRQYGPDGNYAWRLPRDNDPGLDPHTDGPATLIVALWYFPEPNDSVVGGNLKFFRPEPDGGPLMDTLTVPYAHNHFVCWVNGPAAIHGVSPRFAGPAGPARRNVSLGVKLTAKKADLFPTVPVKVRGSIAIAGVGLDLYGRVPKPEVETEQFWDKVIAGRSYAKAVANREKLNAGAR